MNNQNAICFFAFGAIAGQVTSSAVYFALIWYFKAKIVVEWW
jgi:hypothetical protein